ncbi:hypothetical protein EMIT0196MI5_10686 [Pseudomonas sp. IT-196MI5]
MSQALVRGFERDEFFFTPPPRASLYIALAHSRNYGLPASRGLFFACEFAIRDSLKVSSSNKKPAALSGCGFFSSTPTQFTG